MLSPHDQLRLHDHDRIDFHVDRTQSDHDQIELHDDRIELHGNRID